MSTGKPKTAVLTIYLLIILSVFLFLRIPLLDRPLAHDEIYNTSLFLYEEPAAYEQYKLNPETQMYAGFPTWRKMGYTQLTIHPPFLSTFYYCWIKVFGESEYAMRIPVLAVSMASVVMFYFIAGMLLGYGNALWPVLLMMATFPGMLYMGEAVHAPFELSVYLASLLALFRFIDTGNRKYLNILYGLNLLGIFIFYHYLAFLFLQSCYLAILIKEKTRMDKMVFGLAAVCFAGFAVFFIQNILQNYYRYDHWNAPDLKTTLVNALGLLFVPGRLIARGEGIVIHQILLFSSLIFFGGGIFRLISTLKNGDAREKDKIIILAASYCLPFLFYGIVGSVLPKFGHSRNFFYLLPVYILIVFLGLSFIKKPALRHWLSGIGVVLMVVNTMGQTCPLLKQEYVQRAAIRHAAEMDADLVFTPWNLQGFSAASDWSFLYYLKRHHATEKLIPWKNEYLNIPERDIPKTLQDKLRTGKIVYFKPQGESVPNFEEDGRFKRYPRLDMEGYFGPYETLQKRFFKKSRFKAFILNNQAFPNI